MKKLFSVALLTLASFTLASVSFASGSLLPAPATCQDARKSAQTTVTTNLKTIRTSIAELRKKYNGRRQQFIVKDKRSEAQRLNKANREEVRKAHKDLVKKYYDNPNSVTSTMYVDQITTIRAKFRTSLSGSVASGKQAGYSAFVSDYTTMFRNNRSLRFANVVVRYDAHRICQDQQDRMNKERLEKTLNKLKDKAGKIEKRHEKNAKKLQDALVRLEERKNELIKKLSEKDHNEDDGRDDEPSN